MHIILKKQEYLNLRPNPYTEKLIADIEAEVAKYKPARADDDPLIIAIEGLIATYKSDIEKLKDCELW